jgi:hypothetical protein
VPDEARVRSILEPQDEEAQKRCAKPRRSKSGSGQRLKSSKRRMPLRGLVAVILTLARWLWNHGSLQPERLFGKQPTATPPGLSTGQTVPPPSRDVQRPLRRHPEPSPLTDYCCLKCGIQSRPWSTPPPTVEAVERDEAGNLAAMKTLQSTCEQPASGRIRCHDTVFDRVSYRPSWACMEHKAFHLVRPRPVQR